MTQSIEIQRKRQFLLKQTEERRMQLDALAAEAGLSRTAYVQRVLDSAWVEYQVTKAPRVERIHNAIDYDRTMGVAPVPSTPCACDGDCAGCRGGQ